MTKQRIFLLTLLSALQAVMLYRLLYVAAIVKGSLFFYSPHTMMYWGIFYCVEIVIFALFLFHRFKPSRPFWTPTVQNALFASALMLIGSHYLENIEGEKQLQQRLSLNNRTQNFLQQRFIRPTLREQTLSQNPQKIYWQQLGAKTQPEEWQLSTAEKDSLFKYVTNPKPTFKAVVPQRGLANQHREQVQLASQATRSPEIPFALASLNVDTLLPDYQALQSHGTLMINQAVNDISTHPEEGLNHLLDTIRFGQDIAHTGPLIQAVVGLKISDNATDNYLLQQSALNKVADTEGLLRQWENLLKAHRGSIQIGMDSEALTLENMLYSPQIWNSGILNDPVYGSSAPAAAALLKTLNYLPAQRQAYIKYTHDLVKKNLSGNASAADQHLSENNLLAVFTTLGKPVEALKYEDDSYRLLLTAYTQTALADYYRRHQSYPATLEALDNISEHLDRSLSYRVQGNTYQLDIHFSDRTETYQGPLHASQTSA